MRRPQPWHDEARRLRAEGRTYAQIGKVVGKHETNVRLAVNDEAGDRAYEQMLARNRKRYANDEEFRDRLAAYKQSNPRVKLYRMREQARAEAKAQGVAPETIYRQWECELGGRA